MSKTTAVFGKHTIELSNLDKVLFPEDGIVKAELIEYYLKIAPTILRHIKGRPLSLVRYPDGVGGTTFFQKNRPGWAPDWIEHVALGDDEKTEYMLANEEAALAWLANLACIELHQFHWSLPNIAKPDYIVYDLDPPEGSPFERVIEVAFELKADLESLGYRTFVKTTGGKGLHVLTPLLPKFDNDRVFEAAGAVARPFVEAHARSTTLHLKKEARKGRILIDIYRNRTSQSIVAPYSVRGRARAPVSMPLEWAELQELSDPAAWNLHTVPARVVRGGDAWEAFAAYAVDLHTARPTSKRADQTPESLHTYEKKRSFTRTPEPPAAPAAGSGDSFVLHRHHASRLHYDLRLERDGVLRSWAVPKGLPPRPGVKRLAVNTEDHPLDYLRFEGKIPKGEYGGGDMWIFALGKYQITKDKKDGFYFRLRSPEINAEYRMIHTRDKDWLVERVDALQVDWLRDPIDPMLAQSRTAPPESPNYLYEVKWDGIRAMLALDEGQLTIRSRSRRDVTRFFPELAPAEDAFRATAALFDAEIVCLDPAAKPVFEHVVWRLHQASDGAIERARAKHPAVCYIFDCLYLDGRPICGEPLERRREWLADAVRPNPVFRVSEVLDDGRALYEAAKQIGLEGIMAKERRSPYLPGKRSASWLKIKTRNTTECVIIGYTRGKGERGSLFGALHLGRYEGERLRYVGKVGTGFDDRLLKSVFKELKAIPQGPRPVETRPVDDASTVWLEPRLVCEVEYASLTTERTLREPVFLRLRPDLDPGDCADS
jgi:DNA ligase D-like protein (predicted ligase)/DNA ligase D-like protein (predicted polymerase)/DNA ligase D-like protein (predicted 3'-phosphoesterase)